MSVTRVGSGTNLRPELAAYWEEDLNPMKQGFIADRVLPVRNVGLQYDEFGVITLKSMLKSADDTRGADGAYNRDTMEFDDDSYSTKEHGLEGRLDERTRRQYENIIDAEMALTRRTVDQILRNREKRVAAKIFNATTFSSFTTNGSNWSSASAGTPVTDVEAAVKAVRSASGQMPNALIVPWKLYRDLRFSDEIVDRLKYNGIKDVTPSEILPSMLATVFDLDQVIVAGAQENTANEALDASLSDIWTDTMAMVAVLPTNEDMAMPCLGRTFHWTEDGSMGTEGSTVETYWDDRVRSEIYRYRLDVDEKIIRPACGHLLTGLDA